MRLWLAHTTTPARAPKACCGWSGALHVVKIVRQQMRVYVCVCNCLVYVCVWVCGWVGVHTCNREHTCSREHTCNRELVYMPLTLLPRASAVPRAMEFITALMQRMLSEPLNKVSEKAVHARFWSRVASFECLVTELTLMCGCHECTNDHVERRLLLEVLGWLAHADMANVWTSALCKLCVVANVHAYFLQTTLSFQSLRCFANIHNQNYRHVNANFQRGLVLPQISEAMGLPTKNVQSAFNTLPDNVCFTHTWAPYNWKDDGLMHVHIRAINEPTHLGGYALKLSSIRRHEWRIHPQSRPRSTFTLSNDEGYTWRSGEWVGLLWICKDKIHTPFLASLFLFHVQAVSDVYRETLMQYHGFMVSSAFTVRVCCA